jgi:molybdopterin converting factor small subunit
MSITLRLPTPLAALVRTDSLQCEGMTVRELVDHLRSVHPVLATRLLTPAGTFHPYVAFFQDRTDVRRRGGLDAPLRDGGEVVVVSAMAGG